MRATSPLRLQLRHGPYSSAGATKSLAVELRNAIPKEVTRNTLAGHAEVVNLELCTTAADLLAPSLKQYTGCNIIDVNPGAGLWSSTINNLVQPKRHVLVENEKRFDPFIDRLLQSDPSYTRVRYENDEPQSLGRRLRRVVDEGLVPPPEPSQDASKPTTSTLILVNLTRHGLGASSISAGRSKNRTALLNLCQEAWLRSGIQKYGPVRILAWVDQAVKDALVPQTLTNSSASITAQRYTAHMHVVVDNFCSSARADGGSGLEWKSTWQALQRMEAAGLKIPDKLQNPLHRCLLRLGEDWPRMWERVMQTKLRDLDQLGVPTGKKFYHTARINLQQYLKEGYELLRLERLAVDGCYPEETRIAAREEFEKRSAELHRVRMSPNRKAIFHQDLDRHILMNRNPPGLTWDRRPYEPVNCTSQHFFPSSQTSLVALLDVCPSRSTCQSSIRDLIYWERVVTKVLENGTESVPSRLNKIYPGAAEQLIPKLSALLDPLRHGSLQPEHFRARMMTMEMFDEMVAAWQSWPSRPRHIEEQFLKSTLTNSFIGY